MIVLHIYGPSMTQILNANIHAELTPFLLQRTFTRHTSVDDILKTLCSISNKTTEVRATDPVGGWFLLSIYCCGNPTVVLASYFNHSLFYRIIHIPAKGLLDTGY